MSRVAIVGMACRYPDATSPKELWENVLAGRRAFRRLPDVRMRLADYWDADPASPDRFYADTAAVIEGYEFDRVAYKISGSTYRSTDLTHWLALDMASLALADAGFPGGEGLPGERTCVVVGNTLTGEFTRANVMRLRWPYVRRTLAAALRVEGWDDARISAFLDDLGARYKQPFPPINEDSLAGGLSNTIAGRICNYYDLKGGGYTVDGACSSSLLSVATACRTLVNGEADVAIAGGVDLSIDPFEIVGFAKTGALATSEMRVYDRGCNGFWPGEGCGMIVLMREPDAQKAGRRSYTAIAGWGLSSDGRGGITRPEVEGYRLALDRAYRQAGFGIETVAMFEGHGTGTPLGDETELTALSAARKTAGAVAPAAISTIKGLIGHTKAAAGVAGLIKAAMAVHDQVLPPTASCVEPHRLLAEDQAALRVLRMAEPWPAAMPVRAGVSAMGFGGINTHVVLEGTRPLRGRRPDPGTTAISFSAQDVELLLVDGSSERELRDRLQRLLRFVPALSYAELADVAAAAESELRDLPYRAALVVSSPRDAALRLERLIDALAEGGISPGLVSPGLDGRSFLGRPAGAGRIGYLFPGQGSGRGTSGGALRRRFPQAAAAYSAAGLPDTADTAATAYAQPRIVTGSIAGLRTLSALGLEATVGVGHSLGEITALHWAGAMDEQTLLDVAMIRGQTMTEHCTPGAMAGVAAAAQTVQSLMDGSPLVIAGYNGPDQTVISGPVNAVLAFGSRADSTGLTWTRLPVSHAFHSPLVAPAAKIFGTWLATRQFGPIGRRVISTVTGHVLAPGTDIAALLNRQITDPVLFAAAVETAAKEADLLVEVGPGRVLSGLAAAATGVPAVALNTDDESLAGLLRVIGAAYAAGARVDHQALFRQRLIRPLRIGAELRFFASPCEQAPAVTITGGEHRGEPAEPADGVATPAGDVTATDGTQTPSLGLLRAMAAETAELPLSMVRDDSRLLDDLHLSSITVGTIMNRAAQRLGLPALQAPANFATASVRQLAEALDEMAQTAQPADSAAPTAVDGIGPWARAFAVDFDEVPLPPARADSGASGPWQLYAADDDPLAHPLREALQTAGVGPGVLVCLPAECTQRHLELALDGAKAAIGGPPDGRFVLVQRDRGAAGLAKTLHLETHLRVTVVHVLDVPAALGWVVAEVAATRAFAEAYYDPAGLRRVSALRALPVSAARFRQPLGAADVLLVTGGGKGITAECALAVATASGATLAVLGRADPREDSELAANLARMVEAGVTVRYTRADVTDADQVREAVAGLVRAVGPVTAVLHGAGRNEPAALAALSLPAFLGTLAPKIDGLRNVLAAVDPERLRLLVTFGSIIGRSGLRGEAHYATANEWLADLTQELAQRLPECRCLCMEWSVWSGVGMGERLSVVEGLAREGVTPITPAQGITLMERLICDEAAPAVAVISGRAGDAGTIGYAAPPMPLLRFCGKPLVRYHGVELVTEVALDAGTDLYLSDHRLDGNLLFPAVFGMEAMAQVAFAATGWTETPVFEQAEFLRPIVVPPNGSTTIRVAVLVTGPGAAEASIRSAETGFAAEHFRARLRFSGQRPPEGPPVPEGDGLPVVPLSPASDLYGSLLFQGKRFQRLRRYHRAAARTVDADVAVSGADGWFAGFLPGELLLGDPGMRDALMHGCQVCVPHATLLPAGIERVYPAGARLAAHGQLRYCATQRHQDGDTYVYDIAVRTGRGEIVERWEGLRLQAVRKGSGRGPWVAPLLGPYLERALGELFGADIAVAVEPDSPGDADRQAATEVALGRALGHRHKVSYRPDGRPQVSDDRAVSASHGAGVTLGVAATGAAGCDIEPVLRRPRAVWESLLGSHAALAWLVASELGESADIAGTRVWTAIESLQKAGLPPVSPLTLVPAPVPADGWAVFASGALRIATLATTLRGAGGPVAVAVLTRGVP